MVILLNQEPKFVKANIQDVFIFDSWNLFKKIMVGLINF
jgi:hypothetical protein